MPRHEPEVEEARLRKQEKSLEEIREACLRDGVSPKMTDEIVRDTRNAFNFGNFLRSLFPK